MSTKTETPRTHRHIFAREGTGGMQIDAMTGAPVIGTLQADGWELTSVGPICDHSPGPWDASFDWASSREHGVAIVDATDSHRDWKNPVARVLYFCGGEGLDGEMTAEQRAQLIANGDGMDVDMYDEDTVETEANARLIAAAPSLLEAACTVLYRADESGIADGGDTDLGAALESLRAAVNLTA